MGKVEVVWEEPKTRGSRPRRAYRQALEQVASRPGEWARLRVFKRSSQAQFVMGRLKRGGFYEMPAGAFKFCTRSLGDDGFGLYARYLGPATAEVRAEVA